MRPSQSRHPGVCQQFLTKSCRSRDNGLSLPRKPFFVPVTLGLAGKTSPPDRRASWRCILHLAQTASVITPSPEGAARVDKDHGPAGAFSFAGQHVPQLCPCGVVNRPGQEGALQRVHSRILHRDHAMSGGQSVGELVQEVATRRARGGGRGSCAPWHGASISVPSGASARCCCRVLACALRRCLGAGTVTPSLIATMPFGPTSIPKSGHVLSWPGIASAGILNCSVTCHFPLERPTIVCIASAGVPPSEPPSGLASQKARCHAVRRQ